MINEKEQSLRRNINARRLGGNINTHTLMLFLIIVIIFIFMSIIAPQEFLTLSNMQSMAIQLPEFGIMAFGMMFAMMAGGVDLSLVGIANLSSVVAATIMLNMEGSPFSIILAVLAAVAVGALCGAFNGFIIERFHLPAMIVTLATQMVYTGIALIITEGPALSGLPDAYAGIANTLILGIPVPIIIFILVVAVCAYILNYTVYGKELLYYGSNQTTSRYSGINNISVIMKTFILSGILASISGILISSHYNSAKSDYGSSYTLLTLLISVLGGVSPDGGKENLSGVVTAIVLLQLISSAFNILRINAFTKTLVYGLLLLIVVLITMNRSRKTRKA